MRIIINKQESKHSSVLPFIAAILMVMIVATPVSAQGAAEVWLNKASEKLQNKGSEITFRINEEGLRISGKLLIDGQKFFYSTEDMKIWYDGTTQWTLQTGNEYNELYINNPTLEEQQAINPYMLLTNYKNHFTTTDGGERTHNGELAHVVRLKAIDENQDPSDINVYMSYDGTLQSLEFDAPDGHPYRIEVRSMRNGLTFPKDTFTYQSKNYPADEVIDMR